MSMSTNTQSPGVFTAALASMLQGFQTSVPAGLTQICADGRFSTIAEAEAEVQGYLTVYQTVESTAAAHTTAIHARENLAPTAIARFEALRAAVKVALGKESPLLLKFGITPQKAPAVLTLAQKQEREAKAKATRIARGTLGKKQKAAITGKVPAATATPAAAPAPATPAAAPAAAPKQGS